MRAHAKAPTARVALVMAGGTGGHIFPALAVAQALRSAGWRVHWLGAPDSMEAQRVPPHGFAFEAIEFGGVRGKGALGWLRLPLRLARALWQSLRVMRRVQPAVVLGFGGYIGFPGGVLARVLGKRLGLHEQNAVAGMVNRVLCRLADQTWTAFPDVLPGAAWVGNPLRTAFVQQPPPAARFEGRSGPLRLLVVGGSLGAQALNEVLPLALALVPLAQRPQVLHQSGEKHLATLQARYAAAGVQAQAVAFIDDTAHAFADADVVICRAGASTVTELAAVGAAALFVPFAHAVDDHQSANARFLVDAGGGWLTPQSALTPQALAQWLQGLSRPQLQEAAQCAHGQRQTQATQAVVAICEEWVA